MEGYSTDIGKFSGFIGEVFETFVPLKEQAANDELSEHSKKVLSDYRKKMETGEIFDIAFPQQEWEIGLWWDTAGVKIILPNEELGEGNTFHVRQSALKRLFSVVVYKVDEEEKKVYVSLKRAQEKVRVEVIKEIDAKIAEKKLFYAPARIVYVSGGETGRWTCFLDVMGLGIKGVLLVDDWSYEYVRDLREVAKTGDVISVAITKRTKKSTPESPQYQCSRKLTQQKPVKVNRWAKVEEEFPYNSRVSVRCIKKYPKFFVGKILGREDWTAYCYYPDDKPIVVEGGSYRGFVSHVSAEKEILRVRIKEEIPEKIVSMLEKEEEK